MKTHDLLSNKLKYSSNYIGSKKRLIHWIWEHTPKETKSVVDGFNGSAVVGYMYKTHGYKVFSNDRLKYCYNISKAIIENNSVTLDSKIVDELFIKRPNSYTVVYDNFSDKFFPPEIHKIIDIVRFNIDYLELKGYQRNIAIFALCKTCITNNTSFGHFSSSIYHTDWGGKNHHKAKEFIESIKNSVKTVNALVFDNGETCESYNDDINNVIKNINVDLAYFDPPYATQFSTSNYERAYHFIEGLIDLWKDKEIVKESKTGYYKSEHEAVTPNSAHSFFDKFLGNSKHIPYWCISYRDFAYPNEKEMAKLIEKYGYDYELFSKFHQYNISSVRSDATKAQEYLYVCNKKGLPVNYYLGQHTSTEKAWDELENMF